MGWLRASQTTGEVRVQIGVVGVIQPFSWDLEKAADKYALERFNDPEDSTARNNANEDFLDGANTYYQLRTMGGEEGSNDFHLGFDWAAEWFKKREEPIVLDA
jgi:hypothetical protein